MTTRDRTGTRAGRPMQREQSPQSGPRAMDTRPAVAPPLASDAPPAQLPQQGTTAGGAAFPSVPAPRAPATGATAFRAYDAWSRALAEEFFSDAHARRPVVMFVDDSLLSDLQQRHGLDSLETSVQRVLGRPGNLF